MASFVFKPAARKMPNGRTRNPAVTAARKKRVAAKKAVLRAKGCEKNWKNLT